MRRLVITGAAVLAASLAAGGGAVARAAVTTPSCDRPATQAFAAYGDPNSYVLVPGGTFTGGAPGWSLAGGAAATARSVSLPGGSAATSPRVCVGANMPSLRFLVRNSGAATSRLGVTVLFAGPNGRRESLLVASISGTDTWAPSSTVYSLANLLALSSPTGTTTVAFRFAPLDSTGHWSIDDVYVSRLMHR